MPYETGVARYREIARGQILGDDSGFLKLIFHSDTRHLLGVHAIGTGATSLISGSMSGGDAAGNAYELVMKTPDDVLKQSPEVQELLKTMSMDEARKAIATAAAREASKVPAAVGAALGPFGAERVLAGARLAGADLTRANLRGAVLMEAKLDRAQLAPLPK